MDKELKQSDCAFVVIKLKIEGEDWFLMRKNVDWNDVNFVGGHTNAVDGSNFKRTARRELLEEIPPLRNFRSLHIEELTNLIEYGHVHSKSAGKLKKYNLKFFLLIFDESPLSILESLHGRTKNVMVPQRELFSSSGPRISDLVSFLDSELPTGLSGISYSWKGDLEDIPNFQRLSFHRQNRLL